MSQYYPGQHIVASDGTQYVLTHYAESCWWGIRAGSGAGLPIPVLVRYPAWGGDDERAGADRVSAYRARLRRKRERVRAMLGND